MGGGMDLQKGVGGGRWPMGLKVFYFNFIKDILVIVP